jgi:hypothetical protein
VPDDQGLPIGRRYDAVPATTGVILRVEDEFVRQLYGSNRVGGWKVAVLGQWQAVDKRQIGIGEVHSPLGDGQIVG